MTHTSSLVSYETKCCALRNAGHFFHIYTTPMGTFLDLVWVVLSVTKEWVWDIAIVRVAIVGYVFSSFKGGRGKCIRSAACRVMCSAVGKGLWDLF